MRFSSFVFATASALMLTGCSDLLSLNSFVPDNESVADPSVVGTWKGSDDEALYIVPQTNSAYSITYTDKKDTAKFQGHLMNAGEAEILDLVVERENTFSDSGAYNRACVAQGIDLALGLPGFQMAPRTGRATTGQSTLGRSHPHLRAGRSSAGPRAEVWR